MSWLRNGARLSNTTAVQRRTQLVAFRESGSLQLRLAECPWLNSYILWEEPTGRLLQYRFWPEAMKTTLDRCFADLQHVRSYQHPRLDHAANYTGRLKPTPPGGGAHLYVPAGQAFDLYAGQIAHVLYLEANRRVPWSLADMDEVELLELLASNRYFRRIVPSAHLQAAGYYPAHIQPGRDYQLIHDPDGHVWDPRVGYRFLRGQTSTSGRDLIAGTAFETMVNLNRWCTESVAHGPFDTTGVDLSDWFQLEDRLRGRVIPLVDSPVISRAGWGCHATANLLHDLARCINIPLVRINTSVGRDENTFLHLGLVFFDGWESGPAGDPGLRAPVPRGPLGVLLDWWRQAMAGPVAEALSAALGLRRRVPRRRPHVLQQADDMNAFGLAPCFPVDSTGTALSESDKWTSYFRHIWVSRAELARWSFQNPAHYDLTPHADPLDDLPDTGVDGGYWLNPDNFAPYHFERRMLVCSWQDFLGHCPSFNRMLGDYTSLQRAATSPPSLYLSRFNAAIAAAGGCATLRETATTWESARPTNVLADPP